jgi:iron complex transport system substrate-binding protein
VSLLASATEIVCALGLEDRLVGISHECDHPPEVLDRPRVSRPRFDPAGLDSGEIDAAVRRSMREHGSVYQLDAERLAALEPDLVLTQAVCEVCAVPASGAADAVAEAGLDARVLSLDAHSLDEILSSVDDVARAAGVEARGRAFRAKLEGRIEAVRDRVGDAGTPRVLALEWLDPPFAPGHWVPEMIRLAGGDDLVGAPRRRSREIEWESLRGLEPDVLVVMPCGYGLEAARADADAHAGELLRAADGPVRDGRAWVVDASSYFNRSGPRVVTGIEILAGLFHPELAPAPPEGTAARWRPASRPSQPSRST